MATFNATDIQDALMALIECEPLETQDGDQIEAQARSFEDVGIMTTNAGMVLYLPDGTQFQVSIVRSR